MRDLSDAAARYESAGLIPGPAIQLDVLGTQAREIRTPGGTILLVQMSSGAETESIDSLDSFAGISIKTRSLDTIRERIRQSHSLDLTPYTRGSMDGASSFRPRSPAVPRLNSSSDSMTRVCAFFLHGVRARERVPASATVPCSMAVSPRCR